MKKKGRRFAFGPIRRDFLDFGEDRRYLVAGKLQVERLEEFRRGWDEVGRGGNM